MMTKKLFTLVVLALFTCMGASAQTDVTDYITNPDFEDSRHTTGWTRSGSFGPQGNNIFPLKHGGYYMERWNGGNTPIGSGPRLQQALTRLPLGVYTLKVAAMNIRQDNESAKQTGAFLFANDQTTEIGLPGEYTVTTVVGDGNLTIGVYLENCTGNYVCVDNFRLYVSEDPDALRPFCQTYLDKANAINKHLSPATDEQTELDAAVALVERYQSGELSTGITDAITRLQKAIDAYEYSQASDSTPYDMTSKIINPSFEEGVVGWMVNDMGTQGNDGMGTYRDGLVYLEKWGGAGITCSAINTVADMPAGHYTLKAAAHNILQSNEWDTQSGAYIVGETERTAVNRLGEYSVNFTALGGTAEIGFVAENATGNWEAVDNFRLYYRGKAPLSELKSILQKQVQTAQSLVSKQMNASLKQDLQNALSMAQSANTEEAVNAAAAALKPAIAAAKPSVEAYAALLKVINETQTAVSQVSGSEGSAEMQEALGNAMAVYNNGSATQAQMDEVAAELPNALFMYRVRNGSGTPPTVKTHPVIIYGSKAAVGRLEASGSDILECGFCWSENPNPTVFDFHSSDYDEFNGRVYLMPNLKPSTQYYMRAYALSNTYAVGYGDVVRIITGYESDIRWTPETGFNWADDDEARNEQDIAAFETAVNNLRTWTSIRGFSPYLNYEQGKWGADCGYGGWVSAGEGYAKNPGTMLHELGHGIGVGQHWRYTSWDSPLHSTYLWSGERANRVFAFFENQPDVYNADGTFAPGGNHTVADGDRVHVCYGLSGVTSRIDLLRQAAFYQGMYEDGMPATDYHTDYADGDGCCPFYSFESVDTMKYYITNEANGMTNKYLTIGRLGALSYKSVALDELLSDDNYAWRVKYDPYTGFYELRNVATQQCISYSDGKFIPKDVPEGTAFEPVHLMPCRYMKSVKVGTRQFDIKTYWMARANRQCIPEVMSLTSSTSSTLTAPSLNFYDESVNQHWALLDSVQVRMLMAVNDSLNTDRLDRLIAGSKVLLSTPHTEVTGGADATFSAHLTDIEALKPEIQTSAQLQTAVNNMYSYLATFLKGIKAQDEHTPLNITFMMDDAELNNGCSWTGLDVTKNSAFENKKEGTFDFSQTLPVKMPTGTYGLVVRGFQRPGTAALATRNYNNGQNDVTAYIYANKVKKLLLHVAEGQQPEHLDIEGTQIRVSGMYQPSNLAAATAYMQMGFYDNLLGFRLTGSTSTTTLSVGAAYETEVESNWIVIDDFKLYYFGSGYDSDVITDVTDLEVVDLAPQVEGYYTLSGVKLNEPLSRGITIVKMSDGTSYKMLRK